MPASPKTQKALEARARKGAADLREWDRLEHEPNQGWEAFKVYRDMGLDRSTPKVSKEMNIPMGTIGRYSTRFAWVVRAAAWDAEQDRKDQVWLEKERRKALTRHVRQAQALTNKWVQRLQSLRPEDLTPSEVIRYAEVATRLEREALQLDEKSVNVNVSGQIAITDKLSPEETEIRLKALQREITSRAEDVQRLKSITSSDDDIIDAEVVPEDQEDAMDTTEDTEPGSTEDTNEDGRD